jgi:hypothetical protein
LEPINQVIGNYLVPYEHASIHKIILLKLINSILLLNKKFRYEYLNDGNVLEEIKRADNVHFE